MLLLVTTMARVMTQDYVRVIQALTLLPIAVHAHQITTVIPVVLVCIR
jgi:hypothetical protein